MRTLFGWSQKFVRIMAELQTWLNLLKVLLLVILFGIYGTFLFLKRMLLAGPKTFFHYKKRNIRPSILEGNTYGEHIFVRMKVAE